MAEKLEKKANIYEIKNTYLPDSQKPVDCLPCAADHRQLAEWLTELKDLREENKVLIQECDRLIKEKGELLKKSEQIAEYKRLLKAAIKDIGDMSRYCLGMCCDSCPQIHTLSRGYQSCIWQHEDEALKLLND